MSVPGLVIELEASTLLLCLWTIMYLRVLDGNLCKGQVVYDYHVPEQLGLVYVGYSLLSNSMECYVCSKFLYF